MSGFGEQLDPVSAVPTIDASSENLLDFLGPESRSSNFVLPISIPSKPATNLIELVTSDDLGSDIFGGKLFSRRPMRVPTVEEELVSSALSQIYGGLEVHVTSIEPVKSMRKKVGAVYYSVPARDEKLHSVLLFRNNERALTQEMRSIALIQQAGILTGELMTPDRNISSQNNYPFALVRGVPATAKSFYEWIRRNKSDYGRIDASAECVVKVIGQMHSTLTSIIPKFDTWSIPIPVTNPLLNLFERYYSGLGLEDTKNPKSDHKMLLQYMADAYLEIGGDKAVSHGDLHGENVRADATRQIISQNNFGIIDWGTLGWANPYYDLMTFAIHHKRFLSEITAKEQIKYHLNFDALENAYFSERKKWAMLKRMPYAHIQKDPLAKVTCGIDVLINEIFDPSRTDESEIIFKARWALEETLKTLYALSKTKTNWGTGRANGMAYCLQKLHDRAGKTYLEDIHRKYNALR